MLDSNVMLSFVVLKNSVNQASSFLKHELFQDHFAFHRLHQVSAKRR